METILGAHSTQLSLMGMAVRIWGILASISGPFHVEDKRAQGVLSSQTLCKMCRAPGLDPVCPQGPTRQDLPRPISTLVSSFNLCLFSQLLSGVRVGLLL